MGLCCSGSRHNKEEDYKEEVAHLNNIKESSFQSITKFSTETSKDDTYIKQVYSNASKSQNIQAFLQYLKIDTKIEIDCSISLGWISTPKTLSDLAAYQIMYLVSQKKNSIMMLQSNSFIYDNLASNFKSLIENSYQEENLLKILMEQLSSFANNHYIMDMQCKADCFILILANLSEIKEICRIYLQNIEVMDFLIKYCTAICASKSMTNYKQHIIICLQVLRKIYSPDKDLRKHFILNKGADLLNSIIEEPQREVVYEVFYNIQDLVYVSSLYSILERRQ